jgi:predicted nucleic acid-binding protein
MNKIKEQKKILDNKYNEYRNNLEKAFKRYKSKKFEFDDGDSILVAKTYDTVKIQYDVDAIRNALKPQQFKRIVDKEYEVNETVLKEAIKNGDIAKQLARKLLSVKYTVNSKKIEQAFDNGIIKAEDIEDCYTINKIENIKVECKAKE